jgi:hypothetical protein
VVVCTAREAPTWSAITRAIQMGVEKEPRCGLKLALPPDRCIDISRMNWTIRAVDFQAHFSPRLGFKRSCLKMGRYIVWNGGWIPAFLRGLQTFPQWVCPHSTSVARRQKDRPKKMAFHSPMSESRTAWTFSLGRASHSLVIWKA